MWNKRERNHLNQRPRQTPPAAQTPVEIKKETIPVATNPFKVPEPDARGSASIG